MVRSEETEEGAGESEKDVMSIVVFSGVLGLLVGFTAGVFARTWLEREPGESEPPGGPGAVAPSRDPVR